MTRVVVDASVLIKWMLPARDGEGDLDRARTLFEAVRQRHTRIVQPPHWLAEVAAVLSRLSPETAAADVLDLVDLDFDVDDGPDAYVTAVELAHSLSHHLFDTFYHAVALVGPDTTLVTADEHYYRKARHRGAIVRLHDLRLD